MAGRKILTGEMAMMNERGGGVKATGEPKLPQGLLPGLLFLLPGAFLRTFGLAETAPPIGGQ